MKIKNILRTAAIKVIKLGLPIIAPILRFGKASYDSYKASQPDWSYNAWANTYKNHCYVEKRINYKPLISIVVPVFNPSPSHLLETVYSVVNQHYQNWELILVNGSSIPKIRKLTESMAKIDDRIRIVGIPQNLGIAKNTNVAIKHANGEFIAFFDHDDLMHPCALHSVVEAMQGAKTADFVYTDEDKITSDSSRYFNPHCKPGWSPDLLRNVNYITHLSVIRKKIVDEVGGLRSACDGAQDYDLVLRIVDKCKPRIKHVPRILYSWRSAAQSTASLASVKPYITKAGVKALRDHLLRNKIQAQANIINGKPGFYEVAYDPVDFAVVVGRVALTKEQVVAKWLKGMLANTEHKGVKIELIVGEWYKKFAHATPGLKIRYVSGKSRNYWKEAVSLVTKPVAICFKMAAQPKDFGSLVKLAAAAADPGHMAVSPVILDSGGTILDSGIVRSVTIAKKLFEGSKFGKYTYFGNTDWVRNVDDLTTNIVAMRTEELIELVKWGVQSYNRGDTLMSILPANSAKGSKLVVWSHSQFEYRGILKPSEKSEYHNSQLFKLSPRITMHVDNWGEGHVREPED